MHFLTLHLRFRSRSFIGRHLTMTLTVSPPLSNISEKDKYFVKYIYFYTLSEAWSGVNWVDLMAAQGPFETYFYDIVYSPSKASCLQSFW